MTTGCADEIARFKLPVPPKNAELFVKPTERKRDIYLTQEGEFFVFTLAGPTVEDHSKEVARVRRPISVTFAGKLADLLIKEYANR